jgi:predicted NAD/FAD-binding protein
MAASIWEDSCSDTGTGTDTPQPLISILWLVPDDHTALCMPAAVVIAVLADNGLLQWSGSGSGSKNWMSVAGGAKTYVDTIIASIPPENLHLNTDIVAIQTIDWGVKLVEAGGREHVYDHVILA